MRKESRQQRRATGALYKLSGPGQHPERDVKKSRIGQVACRDVRHKVRRGRDRCPVEFAFHLRRTQFVEALAVTQILFQQPYRFSSVNCLKNKSRPFASVAREKPVAAGPCSSASLRNG